jgi:hypothetical protein
MEARIVFEVQNNEALTEQLETYLQGQEPPSIQTFLGCEGSQNPHFIG